VRWSRCALILVLNGRCAAAAVRAVSRPSPDDSEHYHNHDGSSRNGYALPVALSDLLTARRRQMWHARWAQGARPPCNSRVVRISYGAHARHRWRESAKEVALPPPPPPPRRQTLGRRRAVPLCASGVATSSCCMQHHLIRRQLPVAPEALGIRSCMVWLVVRCAEVRRTRATGGDDCGCVSFACRPLASKQPCRMRRHPSQQRRWKPLGGVQASAELTTNAVVNSRTVSARGASGVVMYVAGARGKWIQSWG
jgi:hypothetical protein